jgi:hypothetical protein
MSKIKSVPNISPLGILADSASRHRSALPSSLRPSECSHSAESSIATIEAERTFQQQLISLDRIAHKTGPKQQAEPEPEQRPNMRTAFIVVSLLNRNLSQNFYFRIASDRCTPEEGHSHNLGNLLKNQPLPSTDQIQIGRVRHKQVARPDHEDWRTCHPLATSIQNKRIVFDMNEHHLFQLVDGKERANRRDIFPIE